MTPEPLPYLTADCPGIGGTLKHQPEDFLVEEIPAYEPAGTGEHLFLWIEKRDTSADQLAGHLARVLQIPRADIGMAGLKDRRAVTRQFVSVPARCESQVPLLETENIRVLKAARHGNKLKTAHLRGNRFSILVRDLAPDAEQTAAKIAERIARAGFPNYFGEQRFGKDGGTLETGLALLRGERSERDLPRSRRKFLLRLALSAVQSELFNQTLARRLKDGSIEHVLPGDVMQVAASGGLFVVEDQPAEQQRFETGEIVPTGPLFGPKMRKPGGEPAGREQEVLDRNQLNDNDFRRFAKLTPGSRRAFLVRPQDLRISPEVEGLRFDVTLPAGVYATTLLREFQKPQ